MPMGIGLGLTFTLAEAAGGKWWQSGSALDLDFANSLGFNSIDRTKTTPDSILTYTSPSPKLVYGSDGVLRYAPHNLFLNSGAPATQNVTLITGFSYTVTVTGSGSMAGSSGASGTASAGSPATFVATGTTGTFTLTGSLTTIQLNLGSSALTYVPTTTAAVYSLPIDHNPTTFEPLGVLIEEQRTNLILRSEDFSTGWSLLRLTASANAIAAPDGTTTADQLLDTAVAGTHVAIQTISKAASSIVYDASVYLKASVRDKGELRVSDQSGNGVRIAFNLTTGTITTTATAFGTGFTAGSSSITNVGNGWYRIELSATSNTAVLLGHEIYVADASGNTSYTGNGSGFYTWAAQLEAGAFPTSYIPTVASQVTRAADQVSILTSAFGYSATEGTMVAAARAILANSLGAAASVNDGTGNEEIVIYRDASGNLVNQDEDARANQQHP